jgi:large subunit ribosomal protein L23
VKDPHTIVRQPLITEKATKSMDEAGVYVFTVDPTANKIEIKAAIEAIFDVKVKNVNTVNQVGKRKRLGRAIGFTKGYKKAIVTLAPGHKIDVM